jgi:hypothetical protein
MLPERMQALIQISLENCGLFAVARKPFKG